MRFKNRISLNRALLFPMIAIILILITVFTALWQFDYRWFTAKHSQKVLTALNENIETKLLSYLNEPLRVNQMIAATIALREDYLNADASNIEALLLKSSETYSTDLPQISVYGYGDENQNFVGIRINDDGSKSLMLKDSRTNGLLNIYQNEDIHSRIVTSIENYDPRIRPWYAPLYEAPLSQWSEIYVNQDEKQEITISSIVPILTASGDLAGSSTLDVKLSNINDFLKTNNTKGAGMIYIVDDNWQVIAHSGTFSNFITDKGTVGLMNALDTTESLVRESALRLSQETESTLSFSLSQTNYYVASEPLEILGWRVISVIPETDLIGDLLKRHSMTLFILVMVSVVFTYLIYTLIRKIVHPILNVAEVIKRFEVGDYATEELDQVENVIIETEVFIHAFKGLVDRLNHFFSQLSKSEARYRSLVENSDDMIITLSSEGHLLTVNRKFEENLGRTRDVLVGTKIIDYLDQVNEAEMWLHWIKKAIETGLKQENTFSHTSDEGITRHFYVSILPLPDRRDHVLCTFSDVTQLIEVQKQIDQIHVQERTTLETLVSERTQELERAMRELLEREKLASLGSMVTGIAHEINTPLGIAVSAASYLDTITTENDKKIVEGTLTKNGLFEYMKNVSEGLKIMNSNLNRAATLVNSFKQISVDQSQENLSTFNLKNYIETILISLKHETRIRNIEIQVDCSETIVVTSYPGALTQVFTNLIMNAMIHGFDKNQSGIININVIDKESRILIHILDNGKGISDDHIHHIFEPFYTTKRASGGSGLGLNIVYNLVTGTLHGKISVESSRGKGTQFSIEIPKVSNAKYDGGH